MAITYKVAEEPDAHKEGRATKRRRKDVLYVFLLAAAWVDSGRNAFQSAEQRCQRRYGRIHRFG